MPGGYIWPVGEPDSGQMARWGLRVERDWVFWSPVQLRHDGPGSSGGWGPGGAGGEGRDLQVPLAVRLLLPTLPGSLGTAWTCRCQGLHGPPTRVHRNARPRPVTLPLPPRVLPQGPGWPGVSEHTSLLGDWDLPLVFLLGQTLGQAGSKK